MSESVPHSAIYGHLFITWSAHACERNAPAPYVHGNSTGRLYRRANHAIMNDSKGAAICRPEALQSEALWRKNPIVFSQRLASLELAASHFSCGHCGQPLYQFLFTLTLRKFALGPSRCHLHDLNIYRCQSRRLTCVLLNYGCLMLIFGSDICGRIFRTNLREPNMRKTLTSGTVCEELGDIAGFSVGERQQEQVSCAKQRESKTGKKSEKKIKLQLTASYGFYGFFFFLHTW